MSLTSLNILSKEDAVGGIAAAIQAIRGPGVSTSVDVADTGFNAIAGRAISEARRQLGIDEADLSEGSARKIYELLSAEVDRVLMDGFDKSAVNARLGNRGTLPIGGFSFVFTGPFDSMKEDRKFALSCIKEADAVQHLDPEPERSDNRLQVSLFVKHVSDRAAGDHLVLVLGLRQEATIHIHMLLRLFPRDIAYNGDEEPLELLRMFVEHYQNIVTIFHGARSGYWFFDEEFAAVAPVKDAGLAHGGEKALTLVFGQNVDNKRQWVYLAFSFDLPRYLRDRRLRGR